MKLRLKSHSVRFRLTAEEMEQLARDGCVSCVTVIPTASGEPRKFRYEVAKTSGDVSDLVVRSDGLSLVLGVPDFQTLADESQEGVYLRRAWTDDQGRTQRTVIYVEKDRKGHKKHDKRERKNKDDDSKG